MIDNAGSADALQRGLSKLCDWCTLWQMTVNVNKCFVLHMGRSYDSPLYVINNVALRVTDVANDLGVQVDSKLRFLHHYENVVAKAHQRASLILRCFECRDPNVLLRAFNTYVRPILEYCSPVWAPVYKTDIKRFESVQRRFTKKLDGLNHMSYEHRLKTLCAESLDLRRLKLDLTMMYKISCSIVAIDDSFFSYTIDSQTSVQTILGHSLFHADV